MLKYLGYIVLIGTIVLGAFLLYERKKNDRIQNKKNAEFWGREDRANTVRRKDITYLPYIEIPLESLPLEASADSEVREYQNTLRSLSTKKILNLNGVSNTELKEKYGIANLPILTEYDENYTTLVNTLARWGARLIALGQTSDAITVLEYGVVVGTDVSRNYFMLADLYRKQGEAIKISALIDAAEKLDSIMKPTIIAKLQEIRSYADRPYPSIGGNSTAENSVSDNLMDENSAHGLSESSTSDSQMPSDGASEEDETMRLIESLDALKK